MHETSENVFSFIKISPKLKRMFIGVIHILMSRIQLISIKREICWISVIKLVEILLYAQKFVVMLFGKWEIIKICQVAPLKNDTNECYGMERTCIQ